jgi:hypothetical protein
MVGYPPIVTPLATLSATKRHATSARMRTAGQEPHRPPARCRSRRPRRIVFLPGGHELDSPLHSPAASRPPTADPNAPDSALNPARLAEATQRRAPATEASTWSPQPRALVTGLRGASRRNGRAQGA